MLFLVPFIVETINILRIVNLGCKFFTFGFVGCKLVR